MYLTLYLSVSTSNIVNELGIFTILLISLKFITL